MLRKNEKRISYVFLALVLGLGGAQESLAKDFTAEISYARTGGDIGSGSELTGDAVFASWHLDPVKTDGIPLDEATFLNRNSSVGIVLGKAMTDRASGDYDQSSNEVSLSYGSPEHPWVFQGGYGTSVVDFDTGGKIDSRNWNLSAGYYLSRGLAMQAFYSRDDDSYSGSNGKAYNTSYGIGARWVNLLTSQTAMSIGAELSLDHSKDVFDATSDGQNIALYGSYYFTPFISAGLSYAQHDEDGSDFDSNDYGVYAKIFINPSFHVSENTYQVSFAGAGQPDIHFWIVSLGSRF